jgi:thiol-disulfide isomerase/thioredoxin
MSYANTIEIPETYGSANSFETRMKALVLGDQKQKKSASTSKSSRLPNVFEAVTLQDFKRLVGDERERITVVRFHAPWCRACQRTALLFDRLAIKYPNVKFVKVQVGSESQHLVAAFGIPKFPYGHIYHPTQGLAEELSMNKHVFQDFCRILASYVDESCELPGINAETGIIEAPYQRAS